jgi:hypothetical protein
MTDLSPLVADITFLTVGLSVLLHGVTAMPASNWLAGRIEMKHRREMPEMGEAFDHPTRSVQGS